MSDDAVNNTHDGGAFPTEADFRAAQTELKRLGCYASLIDGDWGPGSRRALTAFQRDFGFRDSAGALTAPILTIGLRVARSLEE